MINVYFTFRANWLPWTEHKSGVFPIYKLDNYTFIISGAVLFQRQTVTPSISAGFIIMLEFLQISITWFSRSSSDISFENPDISTLFLLLYCSTLACNFSRLTIWFSRLTLSFLTIARLLVIFSFAAVTWLRLSVSSYRDLWHDCQK